MRLFSQAAGCLLLIATSAAATGWRRRTWNDTDFVPEGDRRPANITPIYPEFDYDLYGKIGSYYRGSIQFSFNLIDVNAIGAAPDHDRYQWTGDACHEYINRTLPLRYDALVAVNRVPVAYDGSNPVSITIHAINPGFNLTHHSGHTDMVEYTQYEKFQLNTDSASRRAQHEERWDLSVTDNNSASASTYRLGGPMTVFNDWYSSHIPQQYLDFNFSRPCSRDWYTTSRWQPEDFLFSGYWMGPFTEDTYPEEAYWDEWMGGGRFPTIDASFGLEDARLTIQDGFFHLRTEDAPSTRSEIKGEFRIRFDGDIVEEWSDELLVGLDGPQWRPTVGIEWDPELANVPDSDEDDEEEGGSQEEEGDEQDNPGATLLGSLFAVCTGALLASMFALR